MFRIHPLRYSSRVALSLVSLIMLSVVLSEGGLRCLAVSEITSAVLLRPRLALRRLMPWSSANIALSREFPKVLVLLMLL